MHFVGFILGIGKTKFVKALQEMGVRAKITNQASDVRRK
jgi:hypothetical protein